MRRFMTDRASFALLYKHINFINVLSVCLDTRSTSINRNFGIVSIAAFMIKENSSLFAIKECGSRLIFASFARGSNFDRLSGYQFLCSGFIARTLPSSGFYDIPSPRRHYEFWHCCACAHARVKWTIYFFRVKWRLVNGLCPRIIFYAIQLINGPLFCTNNRACSVICLLDEIWFSRSRKFIGAYVKRYLERQAFLADSVICRTVDRSTYLKLDSETNYPCVWKTVTA
jgi:hypothetical protein